ncbi:MAG: FAD-binding protein [Chloroflexi bacterium]|nr:FAD-binding protein [Chloroflexota bacterium]
MEDLQRELRRAIRGEVRFDRYSRVLYSTDASIYQMMPLGVVVPAGPEDVVATVQACYAAGVPLLPRGGGTSLAGQTVNHAVVLDFSKYLDRVLEVHAEERWARVQPGITIDELNAHLRPVGLWFTPDPTTSNRACVGGAIGNNSCGAHSIVYGKTVDHVLELAAVLSDGSTAPLRQLSPSEAEAKLALPELEGQVYREVQHIAQEYRDDILRGFPRIPRRVSGYNLELLLEGPLNLAKLLVGSEGTLAAYTEAKVHLEPLPRSRGLIILHFRTLHESMEATVALLPLRPAAIEMVDSTIVQQARRQLALARRMGFVQGDPGGLLIVEVFGDSETEVRAKLEGVQRHAQQEGLGYASALAVTPDEQAAVWAMRKGGLGLLMGIKGDAKPLPFVEDTAVAPQRLPGYVRRFDEIVRANGTTAAYYGHAGDGCMHIRPVVNLKLQEGVGRMARIADEISDLVKEFAGSLSGEHGDGIVRGVFTEKMFGPWLYQAFRQLKAAFDPRGIMNPGKITDCPPMTENLRYGPVYRATTINTHLDFSSALGFDRAVELCNGIGACRKVLGGTMCPSYMVTREEEHSTRGRANALRAVLSGLLPPSEFTSRRLFEVMDLCLECKGCKAECESGVDMAKLKYEFLAHYREAHGWPMRDRLFADIARLDRIGSALAPVSNWAVTSPVARWGQALMGIHPRRALPLFARPTFQAWFRKHAPRPGAGKQDSVALFADTFMDYNYPSVGIAATRLLEATGYQVVVPLKRCCGRPMVSKGMLERARQHARYNVDLLYPLAEQGVPIVGCEPSCLLTLRDEYPDLLPGDARARKVAEMALLLDEFLVRQADQGKLGLTFRPFEGTVLFHGHCPQTALVGVAASVKALKLVPGTQVEAPDAGCCGMAGAFGFETEHYEVSMKIGERRLFPAVRANPGARVVVTGVSCRQQVEHGTGVRPLHLAEFLAGQLQG